MRVAPLGPAGVPKHDSTILSREGGFAGRAIHRRRRLPGVLQRAPPCREGGSPVHAPRWGEVAFDTAARDRSESAGLPQLQRVRRHGTPRRGPSRLSGTVARRGTLARHPGDAAATGMLRGAAGQSDVTECRQEMATSHSSSKSDWRRPAQQHAFGSGGSNVGNLRSPDHGVSLLSGWTPPAGVITIAPPWRAASPQTPR